MFSSPKGGTSSSCENGYLLQSILANPIDSFIVLAWAAFLLYWGISAIRIQPTKGNRNWAALILMAFAAVGLFQLLRLELIPKDMNYRLWQRRLLLSIIALVIVLIGLFVLIWARRILGSNWNANVETKGWQALVQKGPYSKVRHPMYSGFLTMVLGSALAYGRLLGVAISIAFIAGFCFKALLEESILTKRYGSAYQEYKAKTKALIPYII